jgi:hypothetical protein
MKKQLAKGFTMLMLVMAVSLVTAVVSANGQSRQLRASVPFDFTVGDKTLSAGNYNVSAITMDGDTIKIGSAASSQSAVRQTVTVTGKAQNARLVFHRYGQRYFLAQVWAAGDSEGRQLMKSQQERAIEKEEAKIASQRGTRSTPETVAITMN